MLCMGNALEYVSFASAILNEVEQQEKADLYIVWWFASFADVQ